MKISELCRELDKIRDKYGDIKIEVRSDDPEYFELIHSYPSYLISPV